MENGKDILRGIMLSVCPMWDFYTPSSERTWRDQKLKNVITPNYIKLELSSKLGQRNDSLKKGPGSDIILLLTYTN